MQGTRVQSLVGELRSHMPRSAAKRFKKERERRARDRAHTRPWDICPRHPATLQVSACKAASLPWTGSNVRARVVSIQHDVQQLAQSLLRMMTPRAFGEGKEAKREERLLMSAKPWPPSITQSSLWSVM